MCPLVSNKCKQQPSITDHGHPGTPPFILFNGELILSPARQTITPLLKRTGIMCEIRVQSWSKRIEVNGEVKTFSRLIDKRIGRFIINKWYNKRYLKLSTSSI